MNAPALIHERDRDQYSFAVWQDVLSRSMRIVHRHPDHRSGGAPTQNAIQMAKAIAKPALAVLTARRSPIAPSWRADTLWKRRCKLQGTSFNQGLS
jgi:hypothetical protein